MARLTLKVRLDKGTALLDLALGQDWPNKIDLETLDLANPGTCVLGQLYGQYATGLNELFHGLPSQAFELGFNSAHAYPKEYSSLDRAWTKHIKDLRKERNLTS